jgi:(R,R)-butanediol dehydrogenase/meso-butanediol dehydrogenase/diacetyl reductase/L-iditol 2-dehydrogenase
VKAVCIVDTGVVKVMDMPMPSIRRPDDILVKVSYCSICGDDKRLVNGSIIHNTPPPYVIGHEMSGTIVELGKEAIYKDFSVGDRVTGDFSYYCGKCSYCVDGREQMCENVETYTHAMAEYIVWNEKQLYRIPDNVPTKDACLTEPLTACMRAVELANIHQGSSVAIFGGGGIGLLLLQLARMRGAAKIVVFEPNAKKREMALSLRADYVIDPYLGNIYKESAIITQAKGFDTVIEASGNSDAVKPAFEILGKCGIFIIFAIHDTDYVFPLNLFQFYLKDAVIRSIYTAPYMFQAALQTLPLLDLHYMTENTILFTMVEKAFDEEFIKDKPRVVIQF